MATFLMPLISVISKIFGSGNLIAGSQLDELIQKKSPKSFNNKVMTIINTISHNPKVANTVGSFSSVPLGRWSSDLDLFEQINEFADDENAACRKFAQDVKKIAKRVKNTAGFYWSEGKFGIDSRYDIDIGKYQNDTLTRKHNVNAVKKKILNLKNNKLISDEDYNKLNYLNTHLNSLKEFEQMSDILKSYSTLRWSADDIIRGYIQVIGKRISLEEALKEKTITKIDVVTFLNGRYIECSNFMVFKYTDKKGREHYIHVPEGMTLSESLTKGIQKEMQKLANPKSQNYNLWKLCKRLWAVASFHKDKKILDKLYPLLSSDLAGINQIKADAETLIIMLEKVKNLPINPMLEMIGNFKSRIANLQASELDHKFIYHIIDNIISVGSQNRRDNLIEQLDGISSYLKKVIKYNSDKYVKNHKIVQLGRKYLK